MMRPPMGSWSFIILMASWVQRKVPVRLALTTACHCSKVRSSMFTGGDEVPALLNSTSSLPPKASCVRAKRLRTCSGSPTSVVTVTARSRCSSASAPTSSRVASSVSIRRPASATEYPSRSRASAEARPTPEPAPVTMATRPKDFIAFPSSN